MQVLRHHFPPGPQVALFCRLSSSWKVMASANMAFVPSRMTIGSVYVAFEPAGAATVVRAPMHRAVR